MNVRTMSIPAVMLVMACDPANQGGDPKDQHKAGDPSDTDGGSETSGAKEPDDGAVEPKDVGAPDDATTGAGEPKPGDDDGAVGMGAEIRVVHASPDAPPVDVYVAGSMDPVIAGLAYGETSSFLSVPAGDYVFEIRAAGADPGSPPVFTTDILMLQDGAEVTAIAAGLLNAQTPDEAFRVLAFAEDFQPGGPGTAAVRVVHAGADAPTVGVDVGDDGSVELSGLARFAATEAAGVPLPADEELQLGIVAGGGPVTAFTTPPLPAGGELFVIATGLLEDLPRQQSGFSLLVVGPQGSIGFIRQNPRLYALHASPDAPAVDICTDSMPLIENISFGDLGSVQVPPGNYTLDFFAAPSGCQAMPVYSQATGQLDAGSQILGIATGEIAPEPGDPSFRLETYPEMFSLDFEGQGVFTVIHAASAPPVDVGLVRGGVIGKSDLLIRGLSFPNQSDELVVDPSTYLIGVAAAGPHPPLDPLASFQVPVGAGLRGFVVAAGSLQPGEASFRLFVIPTQTSPWRALELLPQ